jgi:hypothetical protein
MNIVVTIHNAHVAAYVRYLTPLVSSAMYEDGLSYLDYRFGPDLDEAIRQSRVLHENGYID